MNDTNSEDAAQMTTDKQDPLALLTPAQAAGLCQVCKGTILCAIRAGNLRCIRLSCGDRSEIGLILPI